MHSYRTHAKTILGMEHRSNRRFMGKRNDVRDRDDNLSLQIMNDKITLKSVTTTEVEVGI